MAAASGFRKVVVVGAGTMGQQISYQIAHCGFDTTVLDISAQAIEECKKQHEVIRKLFIQERAVSEEHTRATLARISYTTDLAKACRDADLINESVPEVPEIKAEIYGKLHGACRPGTVFTTNSSTLLPSDFAAATGRPDRFLALHFANPVWDANIGEVMPHSGTDPAVFERVMAFAAEIDMVPIKLEKEQNGYVINSMLLPWLVAAQSLVTKGVATPEDVDRTWMISFGMMKGPFAVMDMVGLGTIHAVFSHWATARKDQEMKDNAEYLKKHYVDKNELGMKSGKGYYTYPDPAYARPGFTKQRRSRL